MKFVTLLFQQLLLTALHEQGQMIELETFLVAGPNFYDLEL